MNVMLLIAVLGLRTFVAEPFRIPSSSMSPTLNVGDHIVISKLGYGNYKLFGLNVLNTQLYATVERGDIVVFDFPKNTEIPYVKRVIGLPGDEIEIKDNILFINKVAVELTPESKSDDLLFSTEVLDGKQYQIAHMKSRTIASSFSQLTVPASNYFVMGDNRDNSNDSRYWGFVPEQNLQGKLVYLLPASK